MKIATEKLFMLTFVLFFVGCWSFVAQPVFAMWLLRVVVFVQVFLYLCEMVDRFRF
ncbi:MAG TPA: hypothetical protein VNU95_04005 [Candidatus Acidoferrales bacterium]|jgi:hypothetical protein|nr:hypothetical protein [Candidatus Acidoferrales bacterium]